MNAIGRSGLVTRTSATLDAIVKMGKDCCQTATSRTHCRPAGAKRRVETSGDSRAPLGQRVRGKRCDAARRCDRFRASYGGQIRDANCDEQPRARQGTVGQIALYGPALVADNPRVGRSGFITARLIRVPGRDISMRSYFHTTGRRPGSYGVRSSVDPRWRGARRARVSLVAPDKRSCRADGPFFAHRWEAAQFRDSAPLRSKESIV